MLHPSRITTNNVVLTSGVHSGLGVPLDLGGSSVQHRARENSDDSCLWVQNALLQDGLVLHNSFLQGNIICLNLSTYLMYEKDRVLVAHLQQVLTAGCHQKRVTVVNRVSKLEDEHSVRTTFLELSLEFSGRKTIIVQAVFVANTVEHFQVTPNKPVSTGVNLVDVRVPSISNAERPRCSLLLVVPENLAIAHYRDDLPTGRPKSNLPSLFNLSLVIIIDSQNNGHGHVRHSAIFLPDAVKVQHLHVLVFSHESLDRRGPSF
mmetsp:Transcript_42611/g.166354  ORF Transcript_42611/g.166354 Transcript_42611/m.166354 type:complete len:262 (+) Transcript_42611:980-1765(+)